MPWVCPFFQEPRLKHSWSQKRKVGRGWGHQQHQTQWIRMNEPRATPSHSVLGPLATRVGLWLKKRSLMTLAPAHEEMSAGKYRGSVQTGLYTDGGLESYCVFSTAKKGPLIPAQPVPIVSQYPSLNFSSNLQFSGRNIYRFTRTSGIHSLKSQRNAHDCTKISKWVHYISN